MEAKATMAEALFAAGSEAIALGLAEAEAELRSLDDSFPADMQSRTYRDSARF